MRHYFILEPAYRAGAAYCLAACCVVPKHEPRMHPPWDSRRHRQDEPEGEGARGLEDQQQRHLRHRGDGRASLPFSSLPFPLHFSPLPIPLAPGGLSPTSPNVTDVAGG